MPLVYRQLRRIARRLLRAERADHTLQARAGADVEALDDALLELAEHDQRKSRIVELRVFAGLTIAETADLLGVSSRTVDREWRKALAWIGYRLGASSMTDCV